MSGLLSKERQEALEAHEAGEVVADVEASMATVSENPVYELATVGWRMEGREAVAEYYRRRLPRMVGARGMTATSKGRVYGPDAAYIETEISMNVDGRAIVCNLMTVVYFTGDLIAGERIYSDPYYARLCAEDLGDDFGNVPGVTKLPWVDLPLMQR